MLTENLNRSMKEVGVVVLSEGMAYVWGRFWAVGCGRWAVGCYFLPEPKDHDSCKASNNSYSLVIV